MANKAKAVLNDWTGTNNEDELFDSLWVDSGIAGKNERLPAGQRGFNLSKVMRRTGKRYVGGRKQVEDGDDGFGVQRIPNWVEGWGKYVEDTFGHRNAFAALGVWNESVDKLIQEHAEEDMEDADTVLSKVATRLDPDNEDSFKTASGAEVKTPIQGDIGTDPQGLVGATPILIDPELINTIRAQSPWIGQWVDVVPQAGYTASYNIVSSREEPSHGWSTEEEVRDVTSSTGSAFTLSNDDEDMKIWLDVLDISDFASRAMSSLDFMDLENTSVEVRTQEYTTEMAETYLYGDPDGGASDGGAQDSQAPKGLYKWADDANTSYTIDRSSYPISGDKPLFTDIKSYVRGLIKNTAATPNNLGIVCSTDMFDALENEANINTRIDTFDGQLNFGRSAAVNTLSIANVPILPDPNIRDHSFGGTGYKGNIGDVFIYERPRFQRRALAPFSSTTFGKQGLASRMGLFQYEASVDLTQGEHIRVLEDYQIPAVSDT